jgi:hypothetical protein
MVGFIVCTVIILRLFKNRDTSLSCIPSFECDIDIDKGIQLKNYTEPTKWMKMIDSPLCETRW